MTSGIHFCVVVAAVVFVFRLMFHSLFDFFRRFFLVSLCWDYLQIDLVLRLNSILMVVFVVCNGCGIERLKMID